MVITVTLLPAGAACVAAVQVWAAGDEVAFPANYASGVMYYSFDWPDVKQYRETLVTPATIDAHHARSSLRHGHQLDNVAVVVLVIEAAAAIPVVELSVFEAPGPASEG